MGHEFQGHETPAGVVISANSFLGGIGVIDGSLVNHGLIDARGYGFGALLITRDFIQGNTGALELDIGGAGPVAGYDRVIVGGDATLNGTLRFGVTNDFDPFALNRQSMPPIVGTEH